MINDKRVSIMRTRLGKRASKLIKDDKFLPMFRNRQINRYRTGNYARVGDPRSLVEYKEYNIARQALLDDAEGGKYSYGEENWCTYYSKYTQEWTGFDNDIYHPGMIYFRTGEALQKSLQEHKEQWQIVRKYETGEIND